MMKTDSIIEIKNLYKSFTVGDQDIPVLKDISLDIQDGDFIIIFGPSGCGKSTLLHIILGLEEPTKGNIFFKGKHLYNGSTEEERNKLRKKYISMVYQQTNWIKSIPVEENVLFPLLLLGEERSKGMEIAREKIDKLGMTDWSKYLPSELSSGQQQKVSLARALVNDPEIIIADEPTGNLDYQSGEELMNILTELNKKQKKTVIMVTHNLEYVSYAKRTVSMFDGKIIKVYEKTNTKEVMNNLRKIKQ